MKRRTFVSVAASASIAGCFGTQGENTSGSSEFAEDWQNKEPVESASADVTRVSVGMCDATSEVVYFDESSESLETVKPSRNWWVVPWIYIENPRTEPIDYLSIDEFRLQTGNEVLNPVDSFGDIDRYTIRYNANQEHVPIPTFSGDNEGEHSVIGPGMEEYLTPYFDVSSIDRLAVEWVPQETVLAIDSVNVAGDA